jgi:hypothetical protein
MVTQFSPPVAGGLEQHVRNLARALVDRGHRVEVVTIAADASAGTILDGSVSVHSMVVGRVEGQYERPMSGLPPAN